MNQEINNYIQKRYARWLDYATYHCTLAGMVDESADVLNEVLLSLLQKREVMLMNLLQAKKNQYTELDFYVLRMIKLNCTSDTSPYRAKYKSFQADENIDSSLIEIEDREDDEPDRAEYILDRMHQIREMIEEMGFSQQAMAVFEFRFFQDGVFKEWDGDENIKELYDLYSRIVQVLKQKIKGELIF